MAQKSSGFGNTVLSDLLALSQDDYDRVMRAARKFRPLTVLPDSKRRMAGLSGGKSAVESLVESREESGQSGGKSAGKPPGLVQNAHKDTKSLTLYSPAFESAWLIYPYKLGKGQASKTWKQNKCDQISDSIVAAILKQTEYLTREGGKFRLHFSTWLNAHRWLDVVPTDSDHQPPPTIPYKPFVMPERPETNPDEVKALFRSVSQRLGGGE